MAGYGMRDSSVLVRAIGDYARYSENKRRYDQEYEDRKKRQAILDARWEQANAREVEKHDAWKEEKEYEKNKRAQTKANYQNYVDATKGNYAIGASGNPTILTEDEADPEHYTVASKMPDGQTKPLNTKPDDEKSPQLKVKKTEVDQIYADIAGITPLDPTQMTEDDQRMMRAALNVDENGIIRPGFAPPEKFEENLREFMKAQTTPRAEAPTQLAPVRELQAESASIDQSIDEYRAARDNKALDGMSRDIAGKKLEQLLEKKHSIDEQIRINVAANKKQPQAPLVDVTPEKSEGLTERQKTRNDSSTFFGEVSDGISEAAERYGTQGGGRQMAKDFADGYLKYSPAAVMTKAVIDAGKKGSAGLKWWFGEKEVPKAVADNLKVDDQGRPKVTGPAQQEDVVQAHTAMQKEAEAKGHTTETPPDTTTQGIKPEYQQRIADSRTNPQLRRVMGDMLINGDINLSQFNNWHETGFIEYSAMKYKEATLGMELTKSRIDKNKRDAALYPSRLAEARRKGARERVEFVTKTANDLASQVADSIGGKPAERTKNEGLFARAINVMIASGNLPEEKLGDPKYRVMFQRALGDWARSDGDVRGDSPTAFMHTEMGRYRPDISNDIQRLSMSLVNDEVAGVDTPQVVGKYNEALEAARAAYGGEIPEEDMPRIIQALKSDVNEYFRSGEHLKPQ